MKRKANKWVPEIIGFCLMLSNYDGDEYDVLSLQRLRFEFGVTWQIKYGNTPPNRRQLVEFTVKLRNRTHEWRDRNGCISNERDRGRAGRRNRPGVPA